MKKTDTLSQAAILGMQKKYGLTYLLVPNSFSELTKELDLYWRAFCAQTLKHKQKHLYVGGIGYEYRDEHSRDYKETFHVQLGYQLPPNHSAVDRKFIECSKEVIIQSKPIVVGFASCLNDVAGFDLGAVMGKSSDRWIVRSLNYFPRTAEQIEKGEKVPAARHLDKGHTFGLRESAGGLMVYWNGEWVPISYLEGHIHAYAGLLTQYYTKSALRALCHEVVTTPETEVYGRTAHVEFVDFGDVRYDKGTYGPTQEVFPCGENYDMPPEEFEKYFVPIEKATTY